LGARVKRVAGAQKKDPTETVGDEKIDESHEGEKEKEG
jgi:hypothetical protein